MSRYLGHIHLLVREFLNVIVETTPGIVRAAAQYGVANRIMDLCTFDVTRNPWRCGELFDAIITDPPCKPVNYRHHSRR